MYLQTNGDFEKATLFSFQKGPIFKKMGISTGFYWFFLSFTVHTLGGFQKHFFDDVLACLGI